MFENVTGVWLPREILLNKDLTTNEKILTSVISNNSLEGDGSFVGCKLSNEQLSGMIGVKASKVATVLKSLNRKGAIHVEAQGNERTIFDKGVY